MINKNTVGDAINNITSELEGSLEACYINIFS